MGIGCTLFVYTAALFGLWQLSVGKQVTEAICGSERLNSLFTSSVGSIVELGPVARLV